MINRSKKLIKCKTEREGNIIFWKRALPYIDAITAACGVDRSSGKAWHLDGHVYYRSDDRDKIGFGRYLDGKWTDGLLAFEEYVINESDLIPQGRPKIKNVEIDEIHNDTSHPLEPVKKYTTTQSFTVTAGNQFNAAFGVELEQHWETKATAGGEAYGGSVEASVGGSIKVTTNFGWEKSVSKEKMQGQSDETEIPLFIPKQKTVKVFRKHIDQDMLIKTQLIGILRPAFFVVDYKRHLGRFYKSHDITGWGKTRSRIIWRMRGLDDLYNFCIGTNIRYPRQTENLLKKSKIVKEAYDFFDDADNRSIVQNDERLMRDASATQIFVKEVGLRKRRN